MLTIETWFLFVDSDNQPVQVTNLLTDKHEVEMKS